MRAGPVFTQKPNPGSFNSTKSCCCCIHPTSSARNEAAEPAQPAEPAEPAELSVRFVSSSSIRILCVRVLWHHAAYPSSQLEQSPHPHGIPGNAGASKSSPLAGPAALFLVSIGKTEQVKRPRTVLLWHQTVSHHLPSPTTISLPACLPAAPCALHANQHWFLWKHMIILLIRPATSVSESEFFYCPKTQASPLVQWWNQSSTQRPKQIHSLNGKPKQLSVQTDFQTS